VLCYIHYGGKMNDHKTTFRRFNSDDLPKILGIQETNLVFNMSEDDKADGFLSVEFSPQQFVEMDAEIPIVVADLGSGLGGYLCASTVLQSRKVPILAHMIGLFPGTPYRGQPLEQYRSFIYGPVCIDRPSRGHGIIEGLYTELLKQVAGKFDIGILFISQANPRSLHAHTAKLGMKKVTDFTFNGNDFYLLAFEVPHLPENRQVGQ
jgi:hypothetical protein